MNFKLFRNVLEHICTATNCICCWRVSSVSCAASSPDWEVGYQLCVGVYTACTGAGLACFLLCSISALIFSDSAEDFSLFLNVFKSEFLHIAPLTLHNTLLANIQLHNHSPCWTVLSRIHYMFINRLAMLVGGLYHGLFKGACLTLSTL